MFIRLFTHSVVWSLEMRTYKVCASPYSCFCSSVCKDGQLRFAVMPLVSEMVHPRGFSFAVQRLIALRRTVHHETWETIAGNKKVKTLAGTKPRPRHVANTFRKFNPRLGRRPYKYRKCGKKPEKVTKKVEGYLVRKVRELRSKTACTSTVLQTHLSRDMGVKLSPQWIRKVLHKKGYKWLPRRQKRKYNVAQRKARIAFAQMIMALSWRALREKLSFAMDGVVLAMPPADATERLNFCKHGEDYMWRKVSESFSPKLSGGDDYGNQVPMARAVPMWGGCSSGGFAIVAFHATKKMNQGEWSRVVARGALVNAIKAVQPVKPDGPWTVLSDNESFLRAKVCNAAHKAARVKLLKIPARSPDLNPVERFWAWLRKKLRALDLKDAVECRPVLGKTAYKARVRNVCKSKKAQQVAAAQASIMKRVCKAVIANKGAATRF